MEFEWDLEKAAINFRKHGVSFDEAITAFDDPFHLDYYDPDHGEHEYRYLAMGYSIKGKLLIVSYTDRGERRRLISARRATRKERVCYEEI